VSTQRDLHVRLQERYRRVAKAHYNSFQEELAYLSAFIESHRALLAIIELAQATAPGFDPTAWVAAHASHHGLDLPLTEHERTVLAWWLITQWVTGNRDFVRDGGWYSTDTSYQARVRALAEQVVEPFIDSLQEQLGIEGEVLHMLARFVKQVEWFDRQRLYDAYAADTSRGEAGYDEALRRFLFEQGVDYPYSKPESPSGEADAVALLDTEDSLVCEIKLFDGQRYKVPWLAKGLQQASRYAKDYGKTTAHLVIVNLTDVHLRLPTESETRTWPPRIVVGGVTVFMVVINALPTVSASKQRPPQVLEVSRDELLRSVDPVDTPNAL
jgi:hypothetical protein